MNKEAKVTSSEFEKPGYYGRPLERIPRFLSHLQEFWMTYCPDWRFGQLMCNLDRYYRAMHKDCDFFYLEEDQFMEFIDEYKKRFNQ